MKPYIGFEKQWWILFLLAIGSKSDDGYTFRMVYEETDMGGVNGPAIPGGGNPNADQVRKHTTRVQRLYDMLMNVLDIKSPIFLELRKPAWAGHGVHACKYVLLKMNLEMTPIDLGKMNTQWNAMTCANMKIEISADTISKWMAAVMNAADNFPVANAKTNFEKFNRFVDGLPDIFLSIGIQYKSLLAPPADLSYPAQYAQPHPLWTAAGTVHPEAGQFDLSLVDAKFCSLWDGMIENKQVIVKDPHKRLENVMEAEFEEYTEDEWNQWETEETNWAKSPGVGGGRPNAFPPRNGMRRFFGRPGGKGGKGNRFPRFAPGDTSTDNEVTRSHAVSRKHWTKEDHERGHLVRKFRPVDKTTICFNCGGLGHFAHKIVNGERTPWCRTDVDSIELDVLKGIKYTHIQNPRNKLAPKVNVADAEDETEEFTNGDEEDASGNTVAAESQPVEDASTEVLGHTDFWDKF